MMLSYYLGRLDSMWATTPQRTMTSGAAQRGEGNPTTAPTEGEGSEGDEEGYTPTREDVQVQEV